MKGFTLSAMIFAALALPLVGASGKRVRFAPRFKAGETLRYQIETRTTTTGKATEPIENPEGSSQLKQTANLVVRLDVLEVEQAAAGNTPAGSMPASAGRAAGATAAAAAAVRIHMRATYEKSSAKTESDAYDPTALSLEEQYNRLEGRSMEFTVEPDGKLTDIKGMDELLANPSAAGTARSWMSGIASSSGFPKEGITPGQKWSSEKPFEDVPLAGLIWRTESTYLRDEPCGAMGDSEAAAAPAPGSSRQQDMCSVILTRFEILRRGPKDEQTPEDYRKNGLRTSGTWTGAGQSLDSISLSTSLLVSSTQTSTQEMNLDILSPSAGSKIHYAGRVESESQVTLLPQAPAGSRAASP
jgi:hypothetical protein